MKVSLPEFSAKSFSLFLLVYLAIPSPVLPQTSENTNNQSKGSTNTFTITINSSHGVNASAQRTKDFEVTTYGNLVVGPGSQSIQKNNDGSQGFLQKDAAGILGQTKGVEGFQQINFGEGTKYTVEIKPKSTLELCPNGIDGCNILPDIGTASGSSSGSTSTSISITSSDTSFVNSFIKSFTN